MQYFCVACDYDGTLAEHGRVRQPTIDALQRLRATGRKLILASGRQLDDLISVFPDVRLFECVVAENGGLLYHVPTATARVLADAPSAELVDELRRRDVHPLSVGQAIVATWEPHEQTVLQAIHDLNLDLQVIFNKGAVMVLPSGVNKASGLLQALDRLKLSPHNTVGIGDAENDLAFLAACECAVAVGNALDSVKARVHWVTPSDHGDGVVELVDRLIASDLREFNSRLTDRIPIGRTMEGGELQLEPYDGGLLVTGPSGAGKTMVTTALVENLCSARFQFCVVDPEGDYDDLECAVALRGSDQSGLVDEAMSVLDHPDHNAVINLMDLRLGDHPLFLQKLLPRLLELHAATGRPHWIIIDEAHHLLPASNIATDATLASWTGNIVLVTVHPDHVAKAALAMIRAAMIVGREPQATLDAFVRGRSDQPVLLPSHEPDPRAAWWLKIGSAPIRMRPLEPSADRQRHQRKYAKGELGEDRSFYFRGPDSRLNLRAQNLELFKQMGDGVDDATWTFHLQKHDVSRWFREVIKDESLATEADAIESADLPASESRARMRQAIERRYTAPA
jgi:hydroxymethylpyrimidine pyrophosphatase-like HAD family hydrolase